MLRRTDHALFAAVFLPHLTDAYRLARWLTGSKADAEDVVQEAAIRAFKNIAAFGGANPRAWTLTITRNAAYSWLAKNRPSTLVLVDDLPASDRDPSAAGAETIDAAATPETAMVAKADADDLRSAMARLPPPFREVLVLREIHELDYRTIAWVVGIPVGTVMSRLARARRLLGEILGLRR